MKITKEKILAVNSTIDKFQLAKKLEEFSYAFFKNKKIIKPILEEQQDLLKLILEQFKEQNEIDENRLKSDPEYLKEIDIQYQKFASEHEYLFKFLQEEVDIEFYNIKEDELKGVKFNIFEISPLLETIIVE